MKKLCLIFLILSAVAAYAVEPMSIQQFFQAAPKETPQGAANIITVRGGTVRQLPFSSAFRNYSTLKNFGAGPTYKGQPILPVATTTTIGGIKVGSGLAVTADGTLNNTGISGVASFNGRGGSVKPGFSDYSASMIKGLAAVAKSGSYADLTNKPTIPAAQIQTDWGQTNSAAADYLKNKPTIPTALSQLSQSSLYRTVTDTEKETWNSNSSPVQSVFGRVGAITPQAGDYTATDVGADPLGSATSVQSNLDLHAGLINNPHQVTKLQVGLGNADNTSDLNKPVSTATQTALDAKVASTAFASYTTVDRLPSSVFNSYSATRMAKVNPVYSGTLSTTNDNGTHRLNVLNTVSRAYTPIEGDVDTDANGKLWIYHSGAWVEKGAAYTLPTATSSALGGVKVGNTMQINAGVLDVMVSSLGPTGLVTAGLAGDQTISSGFAYVTTQTGKWTFNSYTSSKQTTLFANYSGTLCAATGSKLYWPNPVTFANQSSLCAGVPKGSRVTAQHQGGKTYATGTKNLQKIVEPVVVVSSCTSGVATVTIAAGGANQSGAAYDTYTYGQSWTPTESGTIYSVSVMFYELPSPSTTSLIIRTGNTSNLSTTYDTTQTFPLTGKTTGVLYEFVLDAHPSFTSGSKKYVMMGSSGGGYNNRFTMNQSNSNPYASGGILSGTSWSATENTSNDLYMVVKKCQ